MKRSLSLTILCLVALVSCGSSDSASEDGTAAAGVVSDTELLRQAQATVNDIVRNAADCDYVTRAAPDVYRALDEAASSAQTAVGRQSVDTLRRQVDRIAEPCGVR